MSDLNVVTMVGYVSYDAVTRITSAGNKVCTFGFVSNRARKNKDDTWEDVPHFFSFNLFGRRAENLGKYLVKGQLVSIVGHLVMDRWESGGQKHNRMNLEIDELRLLGSKKKDDTGKNVDTDIPAADIPPDTATTETEEEYFPPPEEEADLDLDLGGLGEEPAEV
jgi:single stranded DNA-binding protein